MEVYFWIFVMSSFGLGLAVGALIVGFKPSRRNRSKRSIAAITKDAMK